MRKIIFAFLVISLFSCSKKKDSRPLNSIGSSFVSEGKDEDLSAENYSAEAKEILEKHKNKLKLILPQLIAEEVEIYKSVLIEIDKAPTKSLNFNETNQFINQELINTEKRLMEKEMFLNQIYFKLFNELSLLNLRYQLLGKETDFIDFYDAGPIVLSEEVLLKIDEMVKDEKVRFALEKKADFNQKAGIGFDVLMSILRFGSCKTKLKSVAVGAKAAKNKLFLKTTANNYSKASYLLMNQNTSKNMAKFLKNQEKRDKITGASAKVFNGILATSIVNSIYTHNTLQSFKVLDNRINGRIGDFSDGILAVHMQRVRDIIKGNSTKLSVSFAP
jgi:hypothetical protein